MIRLTRSQALASQREKMAKRFATRDARMLAVAAQLEDAKLVKCICGEMSTTHIAEDGLRRTDCCGAH